MAKNSFLGPLEHSKANGYRRKAVFGETTIKTSSFGSFLDFVQVDFEKKWFGTILEKNEKSEFGEISPSFLR